MNLITKGALGLLAVLVGVGCGGSEVVGTDVNPRVRLVNEFPNTTRVVLNDAVVDYSVESGTDTGYKIVNNGDRRYEFRSGTSGAVLTANTSLFELNRHYTVIGYDNGETAGSVVLTDESNQGAGQAGIRFVKVGPGVADSVDFYITSAGGSIAEIAPTFAGVTIGSNDFDYAVKTAGTYRVVVTAHDLKVPLIDDTITVQSGQSITLLDTGTTEFHRLNDEN